MNAQTESARGGLRLVVTGGKRIDVPHNEIHVATVGGEVVDPFKLSVTTLVGRLQSEHRRILAECPCAGPDVLVTLPDGCTPAQIDAAFTTLKETGWEVWPGCLGNGNKIYLGNRADY